MTAQYRTSNRDFFLYFENEDVENLKRGEVIQCDLLFCGSQEYKMMKLEVKLTSREEWCLNEDLIRGQNSCYQYAENKRFIWLIDEFFIETFLNSHAKDGHEIRYDMGGNKIHLYLEGGHYGEQIKENTEFHIEHIEEFNKRLKERSQG